MKNTTFFLILALLILSCSTNNALLEFTVNNTGDTERVSETIRVPSSVLEEEIGDLSDNEFTIIDVLSGNQLLKQLVDTNQDGAWDEVLFQSDFEAKQEKTFRVVPCDSLPAELTSPTVKAYGRHVPERIDDFTWENDKIAFRVYGPKAQEITETGLPGGTLSSGVDCWLKKVPYSVIDKWYAGFLDDPMFYHIDHGEGYDPYHVGGSLGCGGIGVFKNGELYTSKNYTDYNIITDGPVRFTFEVNYAPWMAGEKEIKYKKRISIDLGSNLIKQEILFENKVDSIPFAIGITLHDKKGTTTLDSALGYFSYWEPMGDSELGAGIILPSRNVLGAETYISEKPDLSHLFVYTYAVDNKIEYYSGFGWKGAGEFNTKEEWNNHLENLTKEIGIPLVIN